MPKRVRCARTQPDSVNESGIDELRDGRAIGQTLQQVYTESQTDHRRGAQELLGHAVEPVDAGGDGGLQGGWHADLGDLARADVCVAFAGEHPAVGEVTHDLLDEKRVTSG